MSTMVKPALAVAKDQSVHVVGCPALKGSPRCTCPHPKDQKQAEKGTALKAVIQNAVA